jgi:hypothetical protein
MSCNDDAASNPANLTRKAPVRVQKSTAKILETFRCLQIEKRSRLKPLELLACPQLGVHITNNSLLIKFNLYNTLLINITNDWLVTVQSL